MLDPRAIAKAAKDAGLCATKCWDVDLLLDPAASAEDDAWVARGATDPERKRRQESVDIMRDRAEAMLRKLTRFAELVRELP